MKALLNPATGMVLRWTELRATMSHLQEVVVKGPEYIGQPYNLVNVVEAELKARQGFPIAEEKYAASVPKKKAAPKKKKATAKAHVADAAIAAPEAIGDLDVNNL